MKGKSFLLVSDNQGDREDLPSTKTEWKATDKPAGEESATSLLSKHKWQLDNYMYPFWGDFNACLATAKGHYMLSEQVAFLLKTNNHQAKHLR